MHGLCLLKMLPHCLSLAQGTLDSCWVDMPASLVLLVRCVTGSTYGKLHITRGAHLDAWPLLQLLAGWHNPWPQLLLLLLPLTLAAVPQHMALGEHMHSEDLNTALRLVLRARVEQEHGSNAG